jgi:hypothetical protein
MEKDDGLGCPRGTMNALLPSIVLWAIIIIVFLLFVMRN